MDKIRKRWLPYIDGLDVRDPAEITLLVVHCTELPDLATARQFAERIHYPKSGTGNAGHFYIDRDGATTQYVPIDRVAHHVAGLNQHSIGVELVNLGRYPNWLHSQQQKMTEPYPTPQIDALAALVRWLEAEIPSLIQIAGHEDLDQRLVSASDQPQRQVHRKRDPGPLFPWPELLGAISLKRLNPNVEGDPAAQPETDTP